MNFPKAKNIDIKKYESSSSHLTQDSGVIKLSQNEAALGCSPNVLKIFDQTKNTISRYPDSNTSELKNKIAKIFDVQLKNIIIGSGSDEIISLACQAFINPGDEVVVSEFGFLMYQIYSQINGAKVIFSKENQYKTSINTILDCISLKTKIVFIANPNNPTGTYLNKEEILDLRSKLRSDILLLVDDAYFEYINVKNYKSGLDLFKNSKNVLVTRTFSKIYGLANLRVGWGHASEDIIDSLTFFKPPFNITGPAEQVAISALEDQNWIQKNIEHNYIWSKKIFEKLCEKKIECNFPSANFFLMRFDKSKYNSDEIFDKFFKQKIILRKMNKYKIENALRITVGNEEECNLFLKLIDRIF